MRAAGLSRSVIVITPPAAAWRTTPEAFCFSARISTVVMCFTVALRRLRVEEASCCSGEGELFGLDGEGVGRFGRHLGVGGLLLSAGCCGSGCGDARGFAEVG